VLARLVSLGFEGWSITGSICSGYSSSTVAHEKEFVVLISKRNQLDPPY